MLKPSIRTAALAAALIAAPAFAKEQLMVVEHPVGETTVHTGGAKVDSLGDLLVFANKVFDAANKTQVGTDQGVCVRTVVGKSWECFLTLTLKDGQITTEGPYSDMGDSLWPVTGGTGKYAGARGSMKLHSHDDVIDFTYDLL